MVVGWWWWWWALYICPCSLGRNPLLGSPPFTLTGAGKEGCPFLRSVSLQLSLVTASQAFSSLGCSQRLAWASATTSVERRLVSFQLWPGLTCPRKCYTALGHLGGAEQGWAIGRTYKDFVHFHLWNQNEINLWVTPPASYQAPVGAGCLGQLYVLPVWGQSHTGTRGSVIGPLPRAGAGASDVTWEQQSVKEEKEHRCCSGSVT